MCQRLETLKLAEELGLVNDFISNKDVAALKKGISLFERCSENDAKSSAGVCVSGNKEYGVGTKVDRKKANELFEKVGKFYFSEVMLMPSKFGLEILSDAIMYDKGIGVKRNPAKANECYEKEKAMGFDTERVTK